MHTINKYQEKASNSGVYVGIVEDEMFISNVSKTGGSLTNSQILKFARDRRVAYLMIEKYRDFLKRAHDRFGWPILAIIIREHSHETGGEELQMRIAHDKELRLIPNVLNSLAIYGTDKIREYLIDLEESKTVNPKDANQETTTLHLVAKHTGSEELLVRLNDNPAIRNLRVNGGEPVESEISRNQANKNWLRLQETQNEKTKIRNATRA